MDYTIPRIRYDCGCEYRWIGYAEISEALCDKHIDELIKQDRDQRDYWRSRRTEAEVGR